MALWHERDISHSSVERMIAPDATITLDFALARLAGVIDKLVVYPEAMRKNLDRLGGLIHSQRVLLALTQKGVARDDAYALVQRNAMRVWRGEGEFLKLLKADKDVAKVLSEHELEALFDLGYHLKHVDTIFARVFGKRMRRSGWRKFVEARLTRRPCTSRPSGDRARLLSGWSRLRNRARLAKRLDAGQLHGRHDVRIGPRIVRIILQAEKRETRAPLASLELKSSNMRNLRSVTPPASFTHRAEAICTASLNDIIRGFSSAPRTPAGLCHFASRSRATHSIVFGSGVTNVTSERRYRVNSCRVPNRPGTNIDGAS